MGKKRLNKKKRQVSQAEEFQITHVGFSLKEVEHEPPSPTCGLCGLTSFHRVHMEGEKEQLYSVQYDKEMVGNQAR